MSVYSVRFGDAWFTTIADSTSQAVQQFAEMLNMPPRTFAHLVSIR